MRYDLRAVPHTDCINNIKLFRISHIYFTITFLVVPSLYFTMFKPFVGVANC